MTLNYRGNGTQIAAEVHVGGLARVGIALSDKGRRGVKNGGSIRDRVEKRVTRRSGAGHINVLGRSLGQRRNAQANNARQKKGS